jgi:hypothetical protein
VIPIFCTASTGIEDDKRHKLNKVKVPNKTNTGTNFMPYDMIAAVNYFMVAGQHWIS